MTGSPVRSPPEHKISDRFIAQVFKLDTALARHGIDVRSLLVMAAMIGFIGSFISLAISKWMAKRLMGVHVIEAPTSAAESWRGDTVRDHATRVGIGMPEVGIFDAPEMDAFATGAQHDHALVAVSSGLLNGMSQREAEAVLGHEITHVANGDMVTLALIQGVVNTFVIFLSRAIDSVLDRALRGAQEERRGPGPFYFVIVIVLQVMLGQAPPLQPRPRPQQNPAPPRPVFGVFAAVKRAAQIDL